MRTLCTAAFLILCILFCDTSAHAQSPRVQGSARLAVGIPTGEFADNIDGVGFGGNFYVGAVFPEAPFGVGLDLGFLVYGRDTRNVPFSTTVGPAVTVDVITTNSIVQPHLVLRLQPPSGPVRPYLDGLVGFKYLFTETRVRDEDRVDNDDDGDIASTTNFDDLAFSGGVGAGIYIRLVKGGKKAFRSLSLDIGAQYLLGQEAEYLAEGALTDDNRNGVLDEGELDIRRSATTLIQPQIGVALMF
jgi:hypothetical protein